jgi:exodeoxyribonuclease V gamma subunit
MPGLKVYTSNRLEILAAILAEIVRKPAFPLNASPLSPEIIVVQSKGMERWISMELARHNGICANCFFPFPNAFLGEISKKLYPDYEDPSIFEPGVMTFRIMDILPACLKDKGFESLAAYLEDDRDVLRLFQLSEKIAGLFDQYVIFRPDMIFRWEKGGIGKREDGFWQAWLWRELTGGGRKCHRAFLQKELIGRITKLKTSPDDLYRRISVFGISSLPHFHMRMLEELSRITEVGIFLLGPCREYWTYAPAGKEPGVIEAEYARSFADTGGIHTDEGNRLLRSMGELGRAFFEYVISAEHELMEEYEEVECGSILSCIQSDILDFKNRKKGREPSVNLSAVPDKSVQFHSCHSPMREIETLYDNLLAMFEDDPGLSPDEIIVMAPDMGLYAPFVHAVFDRAAGGGISIPYSVSDRVISKESGVVEGFLSILDLKENRFKVSHVLSLLEYPCIREKFGLTDSDVVKTADWTKETRIRWGIDGSGKTAMGLPGTVENTWRAGLERMLLGYAMPREKGKMFSGISPFHGIEGADARVLGKFLEFLDKITVTAESLEGKRSLNEWHVILSGMLDAFFAGDEETGRHVRYIRSVLNGMLNDSAKAGYAGETGMDVVKHYIKRHIDLETGIAGFMSGGITFCSMLPMRSIPFNVICLLGMNDDTFPGKSVKYSFDLMAKDPRPGDRSKENDDKYIFLEALISARKIFYISYVGQSVQDNTPLPPSILVSELLDYVRDGFGIDPEKMITRHKLQAFSPVYFRESEKLFSYSQENLIAAQSLSESRSKPEGHRSFIMESLSEPSDDWKETDIESLCGFFINPAKYLLRKRLGIYLEEKESVSADTEDFGLDGLGRYLVNQDLVSDIKERGIAEDQILNSYVSEGRLPHGKAGEILLNESVLDAGIFLKKLGEYTKGGRPGSYDVDMAINGFSITGRLTNIYESGMLCFRFAAMKTKDVLRAWIHHLVLCSSHSSSLPLNTFLICNDRTLQFVPVEKSDDNLAVLLDLYYQGLSKPLLFFPGLSEEFIKQSHINKKNRKEAMKSVRNKWLGSIYSRGELDDPYYNICFRNTGMDHIFNDSFVKNSESVFLPLLNHLSES